MVCLQKKPPPFETTAECYVDENQNARSRGAIRKLYRCMLPKQYKIGCRLMFAKCLQIEYNEFAEGWTGNIFLSVRLETLKEGTESLSRDHITQS